MNKKVIIIGASGHGRVISDIVKESGDILVGFLDDDASKESLGPVYRYIDFKDCEFILGIGDASVRRKFSCFQVRWYTAIHPSACVSPDTIIGKGTVIMPNAVINNGAVVGDHCIVNSTAVVEHDNVLGDFVHVSVGAKLGGNVKIGKNTMIGIGSIVINNKTICSDCVIGAGAVVVDDICSSGVYIGVPAHKMDGSH